jgi:hypothetical protein
MRRLILIIAIAILYLIQPISLEAQEEVASESAPIITQMRLPVPASKDKKSKYHSLDDEIAILLSEVKQELLLLYDVIVGIYVDSTASFDDSEFTSYTR